MKTHRFENIYFAICSVLCLSFAGCAKEGALPADASAETVTVSNQLKQIYLGLRNEMGEGDHFPLSFAEIKSASLNSNLFVCPNTGSKAGKMETVEDWTDFIYVGNNTEQVPYAALIISPPENYHGDYGYLLTVDGVFLRLPAAQLRKVVEEPWLLATNTPPQNIDYLKRQIVLRVPKRFSVLYANAGRK